MRPAWLPRYLAQYLFFLRYPILLALVLAGLPLGATARFGAVIRNLFVLERHQLWIVSGLAVLASWVVMYAGGLIYLHMPARVGLSLRWRRRDAARDGVPLRNELRGPFRRAGPRRAIFALLAAPTIACALALAPSGPAAAVAWAAPGVVAAFAGVWLGERAARSLARTALGRALDALTRRLDLAWDRAARRVVDPARREEERVGFEDDPSFEFTHRSARLLFLLSLAVYVAGFFALHPASPVQLLAQPFPALAYLLLLLILLGWMLPRLSFGLDRKRIPTTALLVGLPALLYGVTGTDHAFDVVDAPAGAGEAPALGAERALDAWLARVAPDGAPPPPLVVVTASGGGITAAYWTAVVLTGLQRDLGPAFARDLVLVSATSGGSVGAMYYVDAFREAGPPPDAALDAVPEAAGATSLDALAWGLVYPDLLRLVLAPLSRWLPDRGWAIEERWRSRFPGGEAPTLAGWRRGVGEGWRPAVVFNAVLVETGERLLLGTLDRTSATLAAARQALRLADLCGGADLRATTAARLSATFPYVTPISRPPARCAPRPPYHVADGGYYDNFGVMSALEFLQETIPPYADAGGREVLLVQIRAGAASEPDPPKLDAGFRFATVGPVDAMLSVRTASQVARNDLEVELLRRAYAARARVDSVVLELGTRSPLSWHLSAADLAAIRTDWSRPENRAAVERARVLLAGGGPAPAAPAGRREAPLERELR